MKIYIINRFKISEKFKKELLFFRTKEHIMLKRAFILFFFTFSALLRGEITFENVYPDMDAFVVKPTKDSGYIIGGSYDFCSTYYDDINLLKVDSLGNVQWARYNPVEWSVDWIPDLDITADGGYIIIENFLPVYKWGGSSSVVKTDSLGNILWETDWVDKGDAVLQAKNGGYIATGASSYWRVVAIKIDENGNILWKKLYGDSIKVKEGYSIKEMPDGGYIITGYTYSDAGGRNVYLVRADSVGDSLWAKVYGNTGDETGYSVEITPDNGFLITGYTTSYGNGGEDLWVIKTDSIGNILQTRTYGGSGNEEGRSISRTSDGNYIIAGFTTSAGDTLGDVWLLKVDTNGDTLWTRVFKGPGTDTAYSVQETPDKGYIIAGTSHTDSKYIYLIKTDSSGLISGIPERKRRKSNISVDCYPNPFYSVINFIISIPQDSPVNLSIYDAVGRQIVTLMNKTVSSGKIHIYWDGRDKTGKKVKSGVYLYILRADNTNKAGKLIFLSTIH